MGYHTKRYRLLLTIQIDISSNRRTAPISNMFSTKSSSAEPGGFQGISTMNTQQLTVLPQD